MSFQKGHKFYGDLSKPNYFKKGHKVSKDILEKVRKKNIGNKYALGLKHTKEWSEKMSKLRKEKPVKSIFKKGMIPWNKGKKMSDDQRKKLSIFWKGKRIGKNHPRWRGGHKNTLMLYKARKMRERNVIGSHTFGEWELLKKQYGYICPCCNKQELEIKLTEDHIVPLIKGGSNWIENIQPLCQSCNSKKHTKIIKYKMGNN